MIGLVWVALACSCDSSRPRGLDAGLPAPSAMPGTQATAGSIAGRVRLLGPMPATATLTTSASVRRECGPSVSDRTLVVDESGDLANAVVFVEDLPADVGEASSVGSVAVDQRGCAYAPPVIGALAGTWIDFKNSDPLIHNVHGVDQSGTVFNFSMPLQGVGVQKRLPQTPGVIELRCDLHPWMRAVVWVFSQRHFALTDSRGFYRLEAVPSGKHQLMFWHERLPPRRVSVQVTPQQRLIQDMQWPSNQLSERPLSPSGAEWYVH